ncbi:MAG: iron-containing alcohol dehydrogenase [Termitinemataceae bacterium]
MIGAIASTTKIIQGNPFTAEVLDEALLYITTMTGVQKQHESKRVSAPVLCIIDPRPFPLRDQVLSELAAMRPFQILDQVVPNPTSSDIMDMTHTAQGEPPCAIVGIGGGSTLDSAKAVAMLLSNPGDLDDYLGPQAFRKPGPRTVPLILIPTTTGTGSEVTRFGVYTARSGRKYTLNSPVLQAEAALLFPELVFSLPPALVAATGYDALTHALETLWNRNATAVSDRLALEAATVLLNTLGPAYTAAVEGSPATPERVPNTGPAGIDPNRQSKKSSNHLFQNPLAQLLQAATLAGIAFNLTGTAAIHALSFVLSEVWHVSHGVACAFFTEDVFDINMKDPVVRPKFVQLAQRVLMNNVDTPETLLEKLRDRLVSLKRLMGLPSTFKDLNIPIPEEGHIPSMLECFDKVQDDFKLKNNPIPLSVEQIRKLVQEKLK